jgi:hypothetical protein
LALLGRVGVEAVCRAAGASEALDFVDEYLSLLKPSQPAGAWAKARSIDDNAIWRKMPQKWGAAARWKKLNERSP